MKALKQITKGQALEKLKASSPKTLQTKLVKTNDGFEVSVYSGELTKECVMQSIAKVKKSFPTLPAGFYDVFTQRIGELGMCDSRLEASVNHVIDTCVYPQPTIAQFLGYDKRRKLLTYNSMIKLASEYGESVWEKHEKIKIGNQIYWSLPLVTNPSYQI